ncbi:DUF1294 domain-containing protein [Salibacterium lacus]|uniref:DUF1294 domain-containing protein n=1 Tax=Salibacterium lacus TaxID=1898109 RepID=A0ABW5T0J7_9BACI
MTWLLVYAVIVNVITFVEAGKDKHQARHKKQRTPEKRFWLLTWAGGSAGMLAGMYIFRHKTRHILFKAGVPIVCAVHVFIVLYLTAL